MALRVSNEVGSGRPLQLPGQKPHPLQDRKPARRLPTSPMEPKKPWRVAQTATRAQPMPSARGRLHIDQTDPFPTPGPAGGRLHHGQTKTTAGHSQGRVFLPNRPTPRPNQHPHARPHFRVGRAAFLHAGFRSVLSGSSPHHPCPKSRPARLAACRSPRWTAWQERWSGVGRRQR
jgi:hypothetical protein